MNFDVFGPFELIRKDAGGVAHEPDEKDTFWARVDAESKGLPDACGCYIFCLQPSGGGPVPWYVGKTEKLGFRTECFQPAKLLVFNEALAEYEKATPLLYLLAKRTTNESRFAKPSKNGHRDVGSLEELLIGMALARNPGLFNIKGTKYLKELKVPGILNSERGNPGKAALSLRQVFGISRD